MALSIGVTERANGGYEESPQLDAATLPDGTGGQGTTAKNRQYEIDNSLHCCIKHMTIILRTSQVVVSDPCLKIEEPS